MCRFATSAAFAAATFASSAEAAVTASSVIDPDPGAGAGATTVAQDPAAPVDDFSKP